MAGRRLVRLPSLANWLVALAAVVYSAGASGQTLPEKPIDFAELRAFFEPIDVIVSGRTRCITLDVIVADSRAQKSRGLMYVRSMPRNAGMLFDYVQPRQLSMWMKNTLIPLDILFADTNGIVINIAANTKPLSLDSIAAAAPARYALELNAGVAEALALSAGTTLHVFRR